MSKIQKEICVVTVGAIRGLLQRAQNDFNARLAVYDLWKAASEPAYQVSQQRADLLMRLGLAEGWDARTGFFTIRPDVRRIVRAALSRTSSSAWQLQSVDAVFREVNA